MEYVLIGILIVIELLNLVVNILRLNVNQSKEDKPIEYKMSEEDIKKFAEADVDAVKSFREAIADLNEFMTGNSEEDNKVEQQTF